MYELVSISFPFADNPLRGKSRPGFVISPIIGKYQQVIVAYVTTQLDEILETDIVIDPKQPFFAETGLRHKSLLRLHRLGTFQSKVLQVGAGQVPSELVPELKQKLAKVFQLA